MKCRAANIRDIYTLIEHGASAVAAGSYFVFHGKHRAVLIHYEIDKAKLRKLAERT